MSTMQPCIFPSGVSFRLESFMGPLAACGAADGAILPCVIQFHSFSLRFPHSHRRAHSFALLQVVSNRPRPLALIPPPSPSLVAMRSLSLASALPLLLLLLAAPLLLEARGYDGDLLRPFGISAQSNQDALVSGKRGSKGQARWLPRKSLLRA